MYRFLVKSPDQSALENVGTEGFFSSALLIEDDPAHAALITRALKKVVEEVNHVSSGNDGLRAFETSFPEIVFCDLHLSDVSGLSILKTINELRPGLPIVVLTSSSNLEDAITAMREGAWDYMVKQFSEDLSDRIAFVVERIAERKISEMRELQVRAERDAFWVASHTAQDGLAILGRSGSVVFSNNAFGDFCSTAKRYQFEEAVNIIDLISHYNENVADSLRNELESDYGNSLWSKELTVEDLDNKTSRHFELSLSSVQVGGGHQSDFAEQLLPELRRYVVWVRDVTQRKDRERFQRDLLSTTSHDLKGPLGAILTCAELLQTSHDIPVEKTHELLNRVESCARNSITIIDELLSARRIQDGVLIIKPQMLPLASVVEDVYLDFLPVAKSKSIDFTVKPIDQDVTIYADRLAFTRVLSNLISNAIKFTPSDGVVVVAAEVNGNDISISVSDTGAGIEAKERHLLFERYTRLDKHSDIEGTGLGLYVVRNIIDAHNGKVEVHSDIGKGTTFIVTLTNPLES